MRTLRITLKKKWFDLIKSGEKIENYQEVSSGHKLEEYREIKDYWVTRLFTADNDFDVDLFISSLKSGMPLEEALIRMAIKPTYYALVQAKNGYGTNSPVITWEHKGVRVGYPKEGWCEPEDLGKLVFILDIGMVI